MGGDGMNIEVTVYPDDGTEVHSRTVAYGMEPIITVEPKENEDGQLCVSVISSRLDLDEMARLFRFMAETLTTGERQQRILSPDCLDKNHHKCDLKAWDDEADALTSCECICHGESK